MKFTIINEITNGWNGLAKETVKLQSAVYDNKTFYQVTHSVIGKYKVFTYRTLKGAEVKFNKLASYMVVKEVA